MSEQDFEKVVESTLDQIRETLIVKGKEYRREGNPFHNFDEGAIRATSTREQVLDGFLIKHEVSIADMTNDLQEGIYPTEEKVNEKFNDNIIYLLIKKAMFIDLIND